MKLLPGNRQPETTGGFKSDREGEVVRVYAVAAHAGEVGEGEGEVAVTNGAGDQGGPGDDGAIRGESEEEVG